MKTRTLVILFVILTEISFSQSREMKIDEMMKYAADNNYFNGSIAVLEKGKIIYRNSFGYSNFHTKQKNDNNTVYELASVTKQFTAMAVMMLKERGKLQYTDSLRQYFPELPYSKITLRHLLNHTSGLPDYMREISFLYWNPERIYTNQDAVDELVKYNLPKHFNPGEKFEYNNTGYMLLALIIEKVSGQSFENFLHENIFKKLGMDHTGIFTRYVNDEKDPSNKFNIAHGFMYDVRTNRFELPENIPQLRIVRAMGGLYGDGLIGSSLNDQVKWNQSLFSQKLVRKETFKEAITSGKLNNGTSTGYGFGWFIQSDSINGSMIQHTGGWSGVRNAVVRWLDTDRVLIVLRNNEIDFRGIQDAVRDILNNKPYHMPKPSLAQALAFASNENQPSEVRAKLKELSPDKAIINEAEINQVGYLLFEAEKSDVAIEILKINSELFPQSWNAFDSLGEIYLNIGNKELAIINYKKSIELNPKNEAAKKVLEEIGQ